MSKWFIGLFVLFPVTEISAYIFAAAMGLLWLSTVPLTAGLVSLFFSSLIELPVAWAVTAAAAAPGRRGQRHARVEDEAPGQ